MAANRRSTRSPAISLPRPEIESLRIKAMAGRDGARPKVCSGSIASIRPSADYFRCSPNRGHSEARRHVSKVPNTDSFSAAKLRVSHQRHVHLGKDQNGRHIAGICNFQVNSIFKANRKLALSQCRSRQAADLVLTKVVHATCVDRRLWAHSFSDRRLWAHSFSDRRLWAALHGWELRMQLDCYNSLRLRCRCSWIR
jgi:hypothetical protein